MDNHHSVSAVTLDTALPREMARVQALLEGYRALPGNVGAFASVRLTRLLWEAEQAIGTQDVLEMLRSYQLLKECA